jgi:SUMO ligase MMS21 Smc5/6 complex component
MGAPSYGILSETFLQNIEAPHITQQTKQCMIKNYLHHVNDIFSSLILTTQNIQAILTDFNLIYLNLHFTAESEQINTINM